MQERLQKLIAQAGIASRRGAEEIIKEGVVTVNGKVAELGTKADPETDHIKVRGKLINLKIRAKENTYILLNKPKGYLSSVSDPQHRPLVTDLIKGVGKLHPVGRLDFNTEGLIILTNDGDFTNAVTTSKQIPKVYQVKTKGMPTEVAIRKLRRGIILEDGFKTAPADIKILKPTDKNGWYEVTLFEGHNQQIRKMFDAVAHSVVKLKRIAIGPITDIGLSVGRSRTLTEEEVSALKSGQSAILKTRPSAQSSSRASKDRPSRPAPTREIRSRPSRPSAHREDRPSRPSAGRDSRDRPSGLGASRESRNRPSGPSASRDSKNRPSEPSAGPESRNRPTGPSASRESKNRPFWQNAGRVSKNRSSGSSGQRQKKGPARDDR